MFCEIEQEEEFGEGFVETPHLQKLPIRRGPTSRSHCSSQAELESDYIPVSDEDMNDELYVDSDEEVVVYCLTSGRKFRAKKRKARIWYDEKRLEPQQQICWHMCLLDVYQFRRVLVNLHVTRRRNYHYHRNNKDMIIVDCLEEGCPFNMVALLLQMKKNILY